MFHSQQICEFPTISKDSVSFLSQVNNSAKITENFDRESLSTIYLLSFSPEQSILKVSEFLSAFFSANYYIYEIISISNNSNFTNIIVKSNIPLDFFSKEFSSFLKKLVKSRKL